MRNLRASLIRLAYNKPEIRPHLLPILKEAKAKQVMRLYIMDSKPGSSEDNKKVMAAFDDLLWKNRKDFRLRSVDVDFDISKSTFRNGNLGVDVDLSGEDKDIERAWKSKDDIIYNLSSSINFDTLSKKTDLSPFGITEENFGLDIE